MKRSQKLLGVFFLLVCIGKLFYITADDYAEFALEHYEAGRYEEAIKDAKEALHIYRQQENLLGIGRIYHLLGVIYVNHEQYKEAVAAFKEAFILRQKCLGDHEDTACTHELLAKIYARELQESLQPCPRDATHLQKSDGR